MDIDEANILGPEEVEPGEGERPTRVVVATIGARPRRLADRPCTGRPCRPGDALACRIPSDGLPASPICFQSHLTTSRSLVSQTALLPSRPENPSRVSPGCPSLRAHELERAVQPDEAPRSFPNSKSRGDRGLHSKKLELRIPAYNSHYATPASHGGERPALPAAGSFAVVSLDPGNKRGRGMIASSIGSTFRPSAGR